MHVRHVPAVPEPGLVHRGRLELLALLHVAELLLLHLVQDHPVVAQYANEVVQEGGGGGVGIEGVDALHQQIQLLPQARVFHVATRAQHVFADGGQVRTAGARRVYSLVTSS